ncbi:Fanconi anemia group J protein, partial [Mortierella antarctica]
MGKRRKMPPTITGGRQSTLGAQQNSDSDSTSAGGTHKRPRSGYFKSSKTKSRKNEKKSPASAAAPNPTEFVTGGVRIKFPFTPYKSQQDMMSKIVEALQKQENALLESPTGSGKSLALLCGALAWLEAEKGVWYSERRWDREATKQEPVESPYFTDLAPEVDSTTTKAKSGTFSGNGLAPCGTGCESSLGPCGSRSEKFMKDEPDPVRSSLLATGRSGSEQEDDDDFQDSKALKASKVLEIKYDTEVPSPGTKDPDPSSRKALAHNESRAPPPKIYFGSRTHKQITQLVKELKSNTVYRPKMAVLGGRNHYCIHPKVKKAVDKNDACQELVDAAGCTYKHKAEDLFQEMAWGANIIWDMEDLVQKGEAMDDIRKAMEIELDNAIVILDEAHNIESTARDAGGLEVQYDDLKVANHQFADMIAVFADMTAAEVFENTCRKLLDLATMFMHIMDEQTTFKINNYEESIEVLTSQAWIERLNLSGLNQHSIEYYRQACDKMSKAIKDKKDLQKPHPAKEVARLSDHEKGMISKVFLSLRVMRVLEGIIVIMDRLFNCNPDDLDDYKIAIVESIDRGRVKVDMEDTDDEGQNKKRKSKNQRKGQLATKKKEILFWCLNPGVIFRPISTRARSVILTSGTLSPLDSFASELQTPFPITLEADHVVDKSHVWAGVIPWGPTKVKLDGAYKSINTFGFQDELGRVIEEVIATTPHGVLCFVSSYATIDNLVKRWQQTGQYDKLCAIKEVIIEPRNATNKAFDDTLNKFYTVIADEVAKGSDGGALLFAVYRGKCSEGIDFTDSNCRAVLAVSIPFPSVNDQKIKLKMDYNQKRSVRRPMHLQLQPVPPPRPQSLLDIDLRSINHSTNASGAGAIPALSTQQYRPPILLSGKRWYEIQAFRAYNQAIGRCIRHRKDWGAMVLLDYRLTQPHNLHSLSKWARPLAKSFPVFEDAMRDMKAWITPLQKVSHMEASLSSPSSSGTATESATGKTPSLFGDLENYLAAAEAPGMMASKKTTFNVSSIIEQAGAAVKSEPNSQPDSGALWMIDVHGDRPNFPDDTASEEDTAQEQGFVMQKQETIKIESDSEDMGVDEDMEDISWATPPEGSPEPGLPTEVPANEEDMFRIAAEDVSMFSGDDYLDLSQSRQGAQSGEDNRGCNTGVGNILSDAVNLA